MDTIARDLYELLNNANKIQPILTKESKNKLAQINTYDDVVKTADATSHTLKKIGDVLGKHKIGRAHV